MEELFKHHSISFSIKFQIKLITFNIKKTCFNRVILFMVWYRIFWSYSCWIIHNWQFFIGSDLLYFQLMFCFLQAISFCFFLKLYFCLILLLSTGIRLRSHWPIIFVDSQCYVFQLWYNEYCEFCLFPYFQEIFYKISDNFLLDTCPHSFRLLVIMFEWYSYRSLTKVRNIDNEICL